MSGLLGLEVGLGPPEGTTPPPERPARGVSAVRGNQREGGINKIPCPRKGLGLGPQTGDLLSRPDAPGGRVCAGVSSAV